MSESGTVGQTIGERQPFSLPESLYIPSQLGLAAWLVGCLAAADVKECSPAQKRPLPPLPGMYRRGQLDGYQSETTTTVGRSRSHPAVSPDLRRASIKQPAGFI